MAEVAEKPAREANAWYLLATLHRELSAGTTIEEDRDRKSKNRVAWNRYVAERLNAEERSLVLGDKRWSDAELQPLLPAERRDIKNLFAQRSNNGSVIDLSDIEFDGLSMSDFLFPFETHFSDSIFRERVDFDGATFLRLVSFERAIFHDNVSFDGARAFTPRSLWGSAVLHEGEFP